MQRETWLETMRPSRASEGEDAPFSFESQAGISLLGTLGEGGSAVVRNGVQRSLDREVAVKQPRTEPAGRLLIREARIAARLQHPNILPVHDIVLNEDGEPLILMKRIEGDTWTARMRREGLDGNLAILLQVCNAVAFAHSRGILHRDLKPENIMIGTYGEVVLLDWGLAVRTADLDEDWIPLASEQKRAAGTPAFMAPEMLGDPEWARSRGIPLDDSPPVGPITERTDIYLLGAMLYEILAGRPPHQGADVNQVLCAAWRNEVTPPPGPVGLVEIAIRAMQREPASRYATAEDFRDALRAYVAHQAAVGAAEIALARDDPAGARAALGDVLDVPRGLLRRLEALEAAHLERRRKQEFMDESREIGARRWLVGALGVVFGLVPLPGYFWPEIVTWAFGFVSTAAFLVLGVALVGFFWQRFMSTHANRVVAGAVVVAPLMQIGLDVGAWWMGLDVYEAHALHPLLWAAILGMVAVVLHRGLFVASAACVVAYLVAAAHLPFTYLSLSAGCLAMAAVVFVVWVRKS